MKVCITGGAGFIGSNFIRYLLRNYPKDLSIVNLDKLTYAGNLQNLKDVENHPNYTFVHGDICNPEDVKKALKDVEGVVNFAAETHVDRSILDPGSFIQTDVYGVWILCQEALKQRVKFFLQISTDEVYGECLHGSFDEEAPLKPRSPYAASKAGGDRLAYAYYATHGLPVMITRCSNNYGPYQYPEKIIPLFITNALENKPLPVYGDGSQVRDWIHVEDHCRALDLLIQKGTPGEVYNIGGENEWRNIDLTRKILQLLEKDHTLITFVKDRPGHDRRYALNIQKMKSLGWEPKKDFEEGLRETTHWYQTHRSWWEPLKSGAFLDYYKKQYGDRFSP